MLDKLSPVAKWLVHRASTTQVRGSDPWLGKAHPFNGLINEYQACLGTKHRGDSCQSDHLTGTSAQSRVYGVRHSRPWLSWAVAPLS
ncbi:hypothetical protein TNCV_1082151 [Trichonephila clavipes]|nr:hypothetical protein TNCV_1082151 [Trichonephila clavipes]